MSSSQEPQEPDAPRPTATLRLAPGSTPPSAPAEDWSGRVLAGRYELLREVGRGGMGIVYEARHVALGRRVAVKVLRPELARTDDALVRFEREAKAAAAVGSGHIVEVLDFGREASGEAWMVMEFLDGEDLAARIRREGRLHEEVVVDVLRAVASALRDAHAKGIVHRDLKSENVVLVRRDGRALVKVVDFGISKVIADPSESSVTMKDVLLGTPHYMAPELADPDAPQDHRVDLYALGCIAYEALTGRLPFTGRTPVEVLYQHVHAPVPRVSDTVRVRRALDAIVQRLLAKDPAARFSDAAALLAALDRLDAPRASNTLRLALLAALALTGGALLASRRPSPPRAPPAPRAPTPSVAPAPVAEDVPPPAPVRQGLVADAGSPRVVVRALPRSRAPRVPVAAAIDAGAREAPHAVGVDLLKLSPYARDD